MPGPMGGFDLGDALRTYQSLMNLDEMERRRAEEKIVRERERKYPMLHIGTEWEKYRVARGQNYKPTDQEMEQFMEYYAPRKGEGHPGGYDDAQKKQIMEMMRGPSLAAQKRKNELRDLLMEEHAAIGRQGLQNRTQLGFMSPERRKEMEALLKQNEMLQFHSGINRIKRGFADVIENDPEAAEWVRNFTMEGILGPGASGNPMGGPQGAPAGTGTVPQGRAPFGAAPQNRMPPYGAPYQGGEPYLGTPGYRRGGMGAF